MSSSDPKLLQIKLSQANQMIETLQSQLAKMHGETNHMKEELKDYSDAIAERDTAIEKLTDIIANLKGKINQFKADHKTVIASVKDEVKADLVKLQQKLEEKNNVISNLEMTIDRARIKGDGVTITSAAPEESEGYNAIFEWLLLDAREELTEIPDLISRVANRLIQEGTAKDKLLSTLILKGGYLDNEAVSKLKGNSEAHSILSDLEARDLIHTDSSGGISIGSPPPVQDTIEKINTDMSDGELIGFLLDLAKNSPPPIILASVEQVRDALTERGSAGGVVLHKFRNLLAGLKGERFNRAECIESLEELRSKFS